MKLIEHCKKKIINIRKRKVLEKKLLQIKAYLDERGVNFLYVNLPHARKIRNMSAFELDRQKNWTFNFNHADTEMDKLKLIYGENITSDYILSVFDGGIVVQGNQRKMLLDFESENQHIVNGRRITIGQPLEYHNTIYTHGACTWRGVGVEDSQTIASYLQNHINDLYTNAYKVVNSAIGRGSSLDDDFQRMKEQTYRPGDIVILGSFGLIQSISPKFYKKHNINQIETSPLFDRPHDIGEWFLDSVLHTNSRGNKVIASKLFGELKNLNWLTNNFSISPKTNDKISVDDMESLTHGQKVYGDNPELQKFVKTLEPYKRGNGTTLNGSIVMNCNPFTLGHRYLIEYASSKVDYLYIFVVEENRSYFDFKDRFELVKKGTADLKNVIVLPSGNFIISATTFPGYFYKSSLKEAQIDCSNDINVFAEYIAPALDIKVRFAGQEPLDPVTNQYNEGMAEILPKHGIKFDVIPRKKDKEDAGVISASRVRKCLEDGRLDVIKYLVPPTTYEYLVERYKREHTND